MENKLQQEKRRTYLKKEKLSIADCQADLKIKNIPFKIWMENNTFLIERITMTDETVFHNDTELTEEDFNNGVSFAEGDTFYFKAGKITLFNHKIEVCMPDECYTTDLLEIEKNGVPFDGFPHYKRSPRLIKRISSDKIEISNPPVKKEISKSSLIQIIVPPLIMLCVTAAVSIMMKRGIFVVVSVISTVMSIILSVTKLLKDKKEVKEHDGKRKEKYDSYLLFIRKKINNLRKKEIDALTYNNPSVQNMEQMVNEYSSRIYERSANDSDFLMLSVGMADEPVSFSITMQNKDVVMERDELEQEAAEIRQNALMIRDKPVNIDLKQAHLGLVGEKEVIHEQLKLMIAQLTFFHSYHDLEIVSIFNNKYDEEFKWMNWYPHLRVRAINVYGCVNNERMRDHVLGSMHRIIKDRKLRQEENRKEARYLPHYLFVIDDPKLIADHAIMEYLDKEGDNLGFAIVYTTQMRANLPENIGTILQLESADYGNLLLNNGEMINKHLKLQRAWEIDFERMARNLSVLIHEQGIISQIPESISFFELYQVEKPKELNIEERWMKNQSHKSLAVPLGVRGTDDRMYLNLHEKAHGPHGLVAGTTGSGKSEIIQSYILSLAVNFHPHEVGFLLIDYKGGGMAGLFRNLPHLLGTITNLDGSESMRAMASIKSELARRQKTFSQYNINHINDYNKLFKQGEVEEPIPHLFLISDEFAELKKEQPEFMSELISAARIGRSLGIHLILATQKPSGVVDDQIWTNSRFKLALKVQSESDSKEIIKTPDAAFITQPGRAYLQVGNNEIYELFQSAWSGASYSDKKEMEEKDDRVYLVNELGQGELLNSDLSGKAEKEQLKVTQLDVTINFIKQLYEAEHPITVKKPWLPPLGSRIISPYTIIDSQVQNREKNETVLDLQIAMGLIDIPEEQRQSEYCLDLIKDGNIAFFAAPGYGKTMFLSTVILSLAIKNSVDMLNFYICDFGNSALIPLNRLPHTSDYINMDDSERMNKLIRILTKEIHMRKKLLAGAMVQNFDVYNQTNQEPLKAIIVIVDNYDVVKEIGQDLEDFLAKLSRDGMGLGIYMIITATRQSGVRYMALNNYKNKLAGYLIEKTEATSLVGKSAYQPPEIEGRVLVKHSAANLMQVYSMVPFKNEVDYNTRLKGMIDKVCLMFPTKRAPRIPVLPEKFVYSMLKSYHTPAKPDILLGLNKETVELRGFARNAAPFIILGDSGKGKTNMLKVILEQLATKEKVFLFDSSNRELFYHKKDKELFYMGKEEEAEDFIDEFTDLCSDRKGEFHKALEENPRITPKEFYAACNPPYIVIEDTDEFAETYKAKGKEMSDCLRLAAETGCGIIVTVNSTKTKSFDEITKFFKTATEGLLVGTMGATGIFPTVSNKELPVKGEGLLFQNGTYERIMLPKYDVEA